jgi:glycine cleavage system H protein
MIPTDLKYTESHEWVRLEGNTATIGITHFAQDQLTDIVFVELPDVGRAIAKGGECAVIESCKIAAEMYAPVSGAITAVNEELSTNPAFINQDPYGKGWIAKMELSDPAQIGQLMDAAAYQRFLEQSS